MDKKNQRKERNFKVWKTNENLMKKKEKCSRQKGKTKLEIKKKEGKNKRKKIKTDYEIW